MDVNAISTSITRLSTGSQINSASDNAAGMAITEKMNAEIISSEQNVNNTSDMSNLLSTAEGSLNSIGDSLNRMRELAVQAGSGILSSSDKEIIQSEIEELKKGISSAVKNTEFNTMKLLDGGFTDKNVSMNTSGTGKSISIENTSLDTLGIQDFNVTQSFDISDIDKALEKVNSSRSNIGSTQNAFEHANKNTNVKIYNETNAMSQIKDTDMAAEFSNLKKNQILEKYSLMMQKEKNKYEANKIGAFTDYQA